MGLREKSAENRGRVAPEPEQLTIFDDISRLNCDPSATVDHSAYSVRGLQGRRSGHGKPFPDSSKIAKIE
jgi:hypothetical protein